MSDQQHRQPAKRYSFRMDPDYRAADGNYPYTGSIVTAAAYTRKQREAAITRLREMPGLQWVRIAD